MALEALGMVETRGLTAAIEAADSVGAETFANIICVKAGNEDNEAVKALIEVLTSDDIKQFIENTYEGAVVPVF